MNDNNLAHGKPGIGPTWCSSRKDMILTGLGASRVWATLGYGILNEIYWPSTGRPQTRDLGFIVKRGDEWREVKRMERYSISTRKPYVPLPTVWHEGDGFTLTLQVVCDDKRDVVLVRYDLEGEACELFALLAPRLGAQGHNNTAWCESGHFLAIGDHSVLCLRADGGFSRRSVGYVGYSDGWQDFNKNGDMVWEYQRAERGNVAMTGRLRERRGVLAVAFADSTDGAVTLARSALADGFSRVQQRVRDRWERWAEDWSPPADLSGPLREQVEHCMAVLKTCDERRFPGAVVASLSVPWGNSGDSLGGYHLVWARDSVESAFAMICVGHFNEARELLAYLMATQQPDGHWMQNFFPSGEAYWTGVQLDETSFPVLLAAKLCELGELGELNGLDQTVRGAIGFLARSGAVTPQDRWEEAQGISPFSLALVIAACVGGSAWLDEDERAYALSYADYLNCRMEDWTYAEGTSLADKYGARGHYIRLASPQRFTGGFGALSIVNGGGDAPADSIVGLDYMYLARLGLRRAEDPRMQDTLKVVEGELRKETPSGPCFYRYQRDGYGEHDDGSPFDGAGRGRLWPLLTGERGHLAVLLGDDAEPYLRAMQNMTGPGGLIPEQVWDADAIPERDLHPGKPTGSAMPLAWAHAEFVSLAAASVTGAPVEMLQAVADRYDAARPDADTWHWRADMPFVDLPTGADMLVEAREPFLLHFGLDDWQETEDRRSTPLAFGMHGVRLRADELAAADGVNFTMHFEESDQWERLDHRVRAVGASDRYAAQLGASARS